MNKRVYLALIGATAEQKTTFAKQREANLHKRKLQEDWETFDMKSINQEGMDWDVATSISPLLEGGAEVVWQEGEPMECSGGPFDTMGTCTRLKVCRSQCYDIYLAKDGDDITKYFETFPQYNVFFDLSTMNDRDDYGKTSGKITGWLHVVNEEYQEKAESCKISAIVDMSTPTGGLIDGVNVLAHQWNYKCSFEGQNIPWTSTGNGREDRGSYNINGDEYQMYPYDDIYNKFESFEFILSQQGADLADYFDSYPQYSMFSNRINTTTDPITAFYTLWIYHDMFGEKKEQCYLTANLDSYLAPSEGLTVVDSDMYSYDCSLKDGEIIPYTQTVEGTSGTVFIQDTMLDLYEWETLVVQGAFEESQCEKNPEECNYQEEDYNYEEDWDMEHDIEWEDELPYDYDDSEYDYDDSEYDYDYSNGEEWDYSYDYDNGMEDWDYYGSGETYYYMEGQEKGPDSIMEEITGWFSGDANNKLITAIASIAIVATMQI